MKIWKRALSFLLAVCIMAGFLPMVVTEAEAASRYTVESTKGVTGEDIVAEARKWANKGATYWSGWDPWLPSVYWRTGYTYGGQLSFDCSGFVGRVLNDCGFRSYSKPNVHGTNILSENYGSGYISINIDYLVKYGDDITSSVLKAKNGNYSELRPGDVIGWRNAENGLNDHIIFYAGLKNGVPWMVEFTGYGYLDRAITPEYQAAFKWGARFVVCDHDEDPKAHTTADGKCKKCTGTIALRPADNVEPGVYKAVKTAYKCATPYDAVKSTADAYTIYPGEDVVVVGGVINAYGNLWYETKYGYYVWSGALSGKIRDIDSNIQCGISMNKPTIEIGAYDIAIEYKSDRKVTKVEGWVEDANGSVLNNVGRPSYAPVAAEAYAFKDAAGSKIDVGLKLQNLPGAGVYTLKLRVTDDKGTKKTASFSFTATEKSKPTCAAPVIQETAINGGKEISLSCSTSGVTLYYTTDGSVPTTSSTKYTAPFAIYDSNEIHVLAVRSGYNSSATNAYIYVTQTATPEVQLTDTERGTLVTIIDSHNAHTVYYRIDGGDWEPYKNPFYVKEAGQLEAIACKYGLQNSMPNVVTITPKAPDTPEIQWADMERNVPVGTAAVLTWTDDIKAERYTLTISYEGEVLHEWNLTRAQGTTCYIRLNEVGTYTAKIQAKNDVGLSEVSKEVSVTAMAPVTVTFMDAEQNGQPGEVLSQTTVEYGAIPAAISNPSRRGYDFVGWKAEGSSLIALNGYQTEMRADTVFHAVYTPKNYVVTVLDHEGSMIDRKTVPYQQAATMPDYSAKVPFGYAFAGWAVTRANENDSACDYTCVDSNMTVQAVVRWANENLPVYAEITEAVADGCYQISAQVKNWEQADSKVWIVAALKSTDPVTGAQKTVFADRKQENLAAGEEFTVNFELDYAGNAGVAEVLVLERKDDGTTGSAYSPTATAQVVTKSTWTEWSEWSTEKPAEQAGRIIETMTEYRYQTKETTTSTTSDTMNGWTLYNTTGEWGDYGSWSNWSTSQVAANDSTQVESKRQYRYYRCPCNRNYDHGWYGWGTPCSSSGTYCSGTILNEWLFTWSDVSYSVAWATWGTATSDGQVKRNKLGTNSWWYYKTYDYSWTGERTVYRYRTRSMNYTYFFYRWSDWSNWSDEMVYPSATQNVETRTLYRYSDEVKTEIPGVADTSGTVRTFSGTIGVNEDLQGKKATIMVYQSQNMDANAYQMQYIGQTELGAGNSYSFSFIPKSEPTTSSGNFVVALGIEGTTGLLNVGIVEAPKRELAVKFFYVNEFGERIVLSEQTVLEGEDAVVPTAPERDGYVFLGWSTGTTNLIGDTNIEAVYAAREYTVVFVDWANESIGFQTGLAGTAIRAPHTPSAEGKTFLGWDVLMEDPNAVITENMVVTAVYETASYTVRFLDETGNAVSTQTVFHGESAELPEALTVNGMVFLGWSTDVSWWNVTSDLTVKPIIAYAETTAAPMTSIPEYSSGMGTVLELFAEDDATIYYTLDGSLPTVESLVYTEALYLEETSHVMAMAVSDGKNNSEVTQVTFYYDDTPVETPLPERVVLITKELQVTPGETIDLDVILGDTPGLMGYHFFVECDRSVFAVETDEYGQEAVLAGDGYAQGTIMTAPYGSEGWQVMWFNTEAVEQSGTLFTVPLHVSEEAEAGVYTITISYAPENTLDGDYNTVTLNSGSVGVGGSEDVLCGDANGDGKRNLMDVIRIARHVIGMEKIENKNLDLADVTGDGKITNIDVIRLARYLIGLETVLR